MCFLKWISIWIPHISRWIFLTIKAFLPFVIIATHNKWAILYFKDKIVMKIPWSVLLLFKIFSFILLFCSYVCLDVYHMQAYVCGGQRASDPQCCRFGCLWAITWVLFIPHRSSGKASRALSHWAVSPAPIPLLSEKFWDRLEGLRLVDKCGLAITFAGYLRVLPLCSQHRTEMAEVPIYLPVCLRREETGTMLM